MNPQANLNPPKIPLKFLRWFCNDNLIEDVEGDLSELFNARKNENKVTANLLFTVDVILLFRPGIVRNFQFALRLIKYAMLRNYFKIAIRNSFRHKGYASLNLLGLVVGIASSILILLWVNDEVGMDKFHVNGDRIYQVFRNMKQSNGVVTTTGTVPKPLGDLVMAEYPEVDEVARVSWPVDLKIGIAEDVAEEEGRFASKNFLTLFSFQLVAGDKTTALNELNSILISQTVARKYFGDNWENALSQSLRVDDQYDVIVTGVFEDIGDNSTLDFDFILSAQAFYNLNEWVNDWGNGSFYTYLSIDDVEKASIVGSRIFNEINDHTVGNQNAGDETVILHKFQDTYLYSNFDNGVVSGGRIDYVNIMTVVAIFLLVVACINFMNLNTAQSNKRAKEIGLRKVMGAQKRAISMQFFFEAFLFTTVSVLLSLLVVMLVLPAFNNLVDKSLFIDFTELKTWYFLGGVTIVMGFLSGSYPAILLPAFNLIQSSKRGIKQSVFTAYLRKGLVIFQFAISTLLIIGTSVIYKQIDYILTKDLGIDKENLVAVRMEGDLASRLETYKTELSRIPEVTAVSAASGNPINYGRSTSSVNWEGKNPSEGYEVKVILSDEDFIETMGMEILSGRAFSKQLTDSTNFIINEAAAKLIGFDEPLEKDLSFWGINGKIIGVVKNFHTSDLYEPIAPLIITCIDPSRSTVALIRVGGNTGEALIAIEKVTQAINPTFNFDYEFIDQAYAANYENERTVSALASIFSIISIFISCLGLLGLASYSAEQRSREIGVRKVHGASVSQILILLSKDYSKLMLLAFIIAVPFGYYITQNWLDSFEFRTVLDPLVFILAGIITFMIGVLTVATKSYQAATINPVHSLKHE